VPQKFEKVASRMTATQVRRAYVLLCGFEILPKTISTRKLGSRFILSEPVCAYLLDTAQGWVLLDAGMNPADGRDPARMDEKFRRFGLTPPVIKDAHLLDRQFEQIGVRYEDVNHVILSHLHYDHCGCLHQFTHARVSVQRKEHELAFGSDVGFAYFRDEYDDPRVRWELRDGDWEAMPGLRFIDTRGHTTGHQSAVIDLPSGQTLVLPFDAGDLQENFDDEILPGESCDDDAALAAIRRLKSLIAQPNTKCLLFHDPVAIQKMKLCPEFYD
jgi:N-acyl homoserine lactone hydrolase